jgi:cytoskeletal protein RodZ
MRDGRHLAALLVVLGALALAVPAVALACGSAGNNQYTNPFGGGTTSQPTTTPPQTSSTAAPQPTTSATPPATTQSPGTATSVVTTSDPTATSEPTATAASPGVGTTTGGTGLPRTGYAVWELAGFGLVMVAGGLVIRRRGRRA